MADTDRATPMPRYIQLGDVVVDREHRSVLRGGEVHRMEPRVASLLDYFLEHPGRAVSREELMREVWGGTHVVDEAVMRSVSLLRQALGDDPKAPRLIQSVTKKGYRFITAGDPLPGGIPARSRRRVIEIAVLAGAVILALVAGVLLGSTVGKRPTPPLRVIDLQTGEVRTLGPGENSVAVSTPAPPE